MAGRGTATHNTMTDEQLAAWMEQMKLRSGLPPIRNANTRIAFKLEYPVHLVKVPDDWDTATMFAASKQRTDEWALRRAKTPR